MTNQTKYILAGVAVIVVLLLGLKFAFGQQAQQQIPCMAKDDAIEMLEQNGAHKVMWLKTEAGPQFEVAVKPDTKEWLLFITTENMTCLFADGTGYNIREDQ